MDIPFSSFMILDDSSSLKKQQLKMESYSAKGTWNENCKLYFPYEIWYPQEFKGQPLAESGMVHDYFTPWNKGNHHRMDRWKHSHSAADPDPFTIQTNLPVFMDVENHIPFVNNVHFKLEGIHMWHAIMWMKE